MAFERHDMNLKKNYTLCFLSVWSVKFGDRNWSAQRRAIRKEAAIACSPNLSNHHWWVDLDNIRRTSFIVRSVHDYDSWGSEGRGKREGVRRACGRWKRWRIMIESSCFWKHQLKSINVGNKCSCFMFPNLQSRVHFVLSLLPIWCWEGMVWVCV